MATPSWDASQNSNTILATLQERVMLVDNPKSGQRAPIELLVSDTENQVIPHKTDRFAGLSWYANKDFFYIESTGLARTAWLGAPAGYNRYRPIAQSYVFQIPVFPDDPEIKFETSDFIGIAIDGVPFKSPSLGKTVTIRDFKYTENNVIYPIQKQPELNNYFTDGSGIIDPDGKFYYHSDPTLLYTKNSSQHSPILGYAFDGWPIYGPYGYSISDNPNSGIRIMETGYRLSDSERGNGTVPDGSYIEDFVYAGHGDLDQYNGRECKTPEFPNGTYAYFITVDPEQPSIPVYPYIVGPQYRSTPIILGNGYITFPGDIFIDVISGNMPPGLRIENHSIIGTPYEVVENTEFKFVLRASNLDGISDRTFLITVQGPDAPRWSPAPSDTAYTLPVGTSGKRVITATRRLVREALKEDTIIYVSSSRGIRLGSTISIDSYTTPFVNGTIVNSIDLVNRKIRLSHPITRDLTFQITVNQSLLVVGTTYKIKTIGTTNWSDIGAGKNPVVGTIFVYNGLDITGANGTVYETRIPELTFSYKEDHTNLFVLDNSQIDYQLSAIDNDTATGTRLTYYIPPRGGSLPPGITLTSSGRLIGFTDAILSTLQGNDSGFYDEDRYDEEPYDFGERPTNGYEDFLYDNVRYDYSDPVRTPKKLNRYYEFVVRASDGAYYSDKKFRIFVVGDDLFRSDTTVMHSGSTVYTADIAYLRKPIWITAPNLGRKRANNYITIFLDVFDPATLQGTIGYLYVKNPNVNDGNITSEGRIAGLPPGMMLDQITGEIYGSVPQQPAITRTYEFTIMAIRYDPFDNSSIKRTTTTSTSLRGNVLTLDSTIGIRVGSLVTSVGTTNYVGQGTIVIEVNPIKKTVTLSQGVSILVPVGISFIFTFIVSSTRTFTIDLMGDIESTIHFITDGDLGLIDANFVSTLAVEAVTSITSASLSYALVGGRLPPGITLVNDGTLQGKINQFGTSTNPGLTIIDGNITSFDNHKTSLDREYLFTVEAKDQFTYSAVAKTFKIAVNTPNNKLYSNIYVKPFMKRDNRITVTSFLTDPGIFVREKIYRMGDPEFGIQTDLKMLLYPGIETKTAAQYASAFGRTSWKRFRIGELKKAVGKKPGTNTVIYEVIYLQIIDNLENETSSVPMTIKTKNIPFRTSINQGRRDTIDSDIYDNNINKMSEDVLPRIMMQDRVISVDYGGQLISDDFKTIFGNSVTNIRKIISAVGDTERNYLPLWMRTPQTRSGVEQGFTKAIPLCYCLPGEADYIILNIKNSKFDFTTIDLTIDRAIIDSVTGEYGDKYIAFPAREVING